MKTKLAFPSLLVIAVVSAHAEADAQYHAREIAPTGDRVFAVAQGATPTTAHAEGTIVISAGTTTKEIDVAHGTVVAQQPFACRPLRRYGGALFGICDGDVVAFGGNLAVTWRAHRPSTEQLAPNELFSNGQLVVATYCTNTSVVIRVLTMGGAEVSQFQPAIPTYDCRVRFAVSAHGATIIVHEWHPTQMRSDLFVLSTDGRSMRASRSTTNFDMAWDDGARIHIVHAGRDTIFDDDLHPIRTQAQTPSVDTVAFKPQQVDGLGGTGTLEEFDLGANHFWLTFGCCGDHGGLFVAKVR
jgi:hypothetical protein